MKQDTATDIVWKLNHEKEIFGSGWSVSTNKERQKARARDFAYRDIWTVEVVYKKEEAEIQLPPEFLDFICERDISVTVDLSGFSDRWSRNPDYRTRFILDDGKFEKVEYTEEEQQRRELQRNISRTFDVQRPVAETLSENFDSIDEILSASREELTSIQGIGDSRANKILHHYSQKAKERLEGRKSGILVIPDQDGVLRLPEEFESGDYTPDYSNVSGVGKESDEE